MLRQCTAPSDCTQMCMKVMLVYCCFDLSPVWAQAQSCSLVLVCLISLCLRCLSHGAPLCPRGVCVPAQAGGCACRATQLHKCSGGTASLGLRMQHQTSGCSPCTARGGGFLSLPAPHFCCLQASNVCRLPGIDVLSAVSSLAGSLCTAIRLYLLHEQYCTFRAL